MNALLTAVLAAALSPCRAAAPVPCGAGDETGRVVAVSVEVDGRRTPLFAAPDGSARRYLEARQGAEYVLHLRNLTGGRVAVHARVDGLNVISGEAEPRGARGRMYVLGPWDSLAVRGWRTSLEEVRRFTFVDEKRSYAARTGQASNRLGWIEIDVYRERVRPREEQPITRDRGESERAAPRAQAPAKREENDTRADAAGAAPPTSYPGTGWGEAAHDPARVVSFDAERRAAETVTLRYEYASGLRALGIDVRPRQADRLVERDRGTGFARPPRD